MEHLWMTDSMIYMTSLLVFIKSFYENPLNLLAILKTVNHSSNKSLKSHLVCCFSFSHYHQFLILILVTKFHMKWSSKEKLSFYHIISQSNGNSWGLLISLRSSFMWYLSHMKIFKTNVWMIVTRVDMVQWKKDCKCPWNKTLAVKKKNLKFSIA